jgi:hypothetical protein
VERAEDAQKHRGRKLGLAAGGTKIDIVRAGSKEKVGRAGFEPAKA